MTNIDGVQPKVPEAGGSFHIQHLQEMKRNAWHFYIDWKIELLFLFRRALATGRSMIMIVVVSLHIVQNFLGNEGDDVLHGGLN
jgi:hypothetical protein